MLDVLKEAEYDVIGVGKINDIFAGKGITEFVRTQDNADGIEKTLEYMEREFNGLCFVNLVDFDMLYGHRNDVAGYAKALTYFDRQLPRILSAMEPEDVLMITADHGCDPGTPSTDHSREYTPFVMYGKNLAQGKNLGTRDSFSDIGATVLDYFGLSGGIAGKMYAVRARYRGRQIVWAVFRSVFRNGVRNRCVTVLSDRCFSLYYNR